MRDDFIEVGFHRPDRVAQLRSQRGQAKPNVDQRFVQNVGSQRLLAAAAQGSRLDRRLWTAVAEATGARGNTTALVGTAEQVAEKVQGFVDAGCREFILWFRDSPGTDSLDAMVRDVAPMISA